MGNKKIRHVCIGLYKNADVGLVDRYVSGLMKEKELFLIYDKEQRGERVHVHIVMDKVLDDTAEMEFKKIGYLAVTDIQKDSLGALMQYLVR